MANCVSMMACMYSRVYLDVLCMILQKTFASLFKAQLLGISTTNNIIIVIIILPQKILIKLHPKMP